jgi:peptidoglycan L-alanyl-D-glutamate endopeptidase CwlK
MSSLREEQSAFARDIVRLLTYASGLGYEYTFGEFERPIEMQKLHVAAGRSKTMNSNHVRRCAADIYFFKGGELTYDIEELGRFWESLSPKNSWGGNWASFKDKPHFERRP